MKTKFKLAALTMAMGTTFAAHAAPVPTVANWFGGTLLASTSVSFTQPEAPVPVWNEDHQEWDYRGPPSIGPIGSGTFKSAVYENSDGYLDFYYQVQKTSISDWSKFDASAGMDNLIVKGSEFRYGYAVFQTAAAFDGFGVGTVKALGVDVVGREDDRDGREDFTFYMDRSGGNPEAANTFTEIIRSSQRRFNEYAPGSFTRGYEYSGSMNVTGGLPENGFESSVQGVLVSAVPEPETYAMLLAGLGLIGGIARRRKAQSA